MGSSTGTTSGGSRMRRAVSLALVLLAALGLLGASTATWAKRTVLDTDRFTVLAADVLRDPRVVDSVTRATTTQVLSLVERIDPVGSALPDQLDPLRPYLDGALQNLVDGQVRRLVASDGGQQLLLRGVRTAHAGTMDLLSGNGVLDGRVQVDERQIRLDLRPLIVRALDALQERSRLLRAVELPDPGDPDAVAALEREFGITLPERFGQVVIYDSEQVSRAADGVGQVQYAFALFQQGLLVLWALTGLLAVGAFVVSTRPLRTLFQFGVAIAAAMAVQRVVVDRITTAIPAVVSSPDAQTVTAAAVSTAAAGLQRLTLVLLVLGVVLAAIGWLSSRPRAQRATAAGAPAPGGALVAWVGANADLARVTVLVLLLAVLTAWGLSVPSLVVIAAIGVVAMAAIGAAGRPGPAAVPAVDPTA